MIRADQIRSAFFSACGALALLAAAPTPAVADDARIQTRVFDEGQVFQINGRVKVQTTIKFAPDEAIENVAIGDSAAWQVQPNRAQTILFVKPLEPAARTNLTVVTDRRTYLFDLVASPRNAPLYVMQFRSRDIEQAEEEARLAALAEAEREEANPFEMAAASDPYAVVDPAMLNFEWARSGKTSLLPERIYDDGDAVFLSWLQGNAIPAILVLSPSGEEGPVNYTVRGDMVVVDGVPDQIVLRSGKDVATLINLALIKPKGRRSARSERQKGGAE